MYIYRSSDESMIGSMNGDDILTFAGHRIGYVSAEWSSPRATIFHEGERPWSVGYVDGNDVYNTDRDRVGWIDGVNIMRADGTKAGWVLDAESAVGGAGLLLLL